MKKFVLAVAIVAVLAMFFTSAGYAYTASTENSGNSVSSQYVVLTQQNYTFASGDVSFDVIETEAGIKYQLSGNVVSLTDVEGEGYMGVKIGDDKLSATMTGGPGGVLDVMISSPEIDNGWFTDYSDGLHSWRYVLKVSADYTATKTAAEIVDIQNPTVGECYKVSTAGNIGTLGNVPSGSIVGYDGFAWILMTDQYAYYNGAEGGVWIVKGQTIESEYRVQATDADAGGYIGLYNDDTINDVNVFVIDGNYHVHKFTNVGITEPFDLVEKVGGGPWYVNGRVIDEGKYTVETTDTDGGCNVVIYKLKTASNYTVVKMGNDPDTLSNQAAGATVGGVAGWYYGGGVEFRILTGVTYTTELYFAGPGGNVSTSLRSEGTVIKAPSQITIMPEWVPVTTSDIKSGTYVKYTLRSDESDGADRRVVYVKSGSNVMLPENCFTTPQNKVFVGWKADNLDKIFTSEHIYTNFTEERTFTAQWAEESECWTVTFLPGEGGAGSMGVRYILKNADSGNTFTLPPYEFTSKGHKFTGWVVSGPQNSERNYSKYNTYFVDIPAVKENLTVTAQWEEAAIGSEDVSISFGSNTVVKVASNNTATVLSGLHIGDTVTGVQNWYVKGNQVTESSYTLKDSDIVHGGYIVLYQTPNIANKYSVIEVEGDSAIVKPNLNVDDKVGSVGGWMINGSLVYAAPYYVNANDADSADSRFIVVYEVTNPKDEYTVIKIPTSVGSPSIIRGLHAGDAVTGVQNWYVKGVQKGNYVVNADDAVNGFIVICESKSSSLEGKYTVVKVTASNFSVLNNKEPNVAITGVKGWKVKGEEVGTYTVRSQDASVIGGGYILLYDNSAADYVLHTSANGSYKLPYCIMAAPDDPGILNFKGWKLMGWQVISVPGRSVPQSYAMPDGTDGYIVKNATIKFTYNSSLRNGEEQA